MPRLFLTPLSIDIQFKRIRNNIRTKRDQLKIDIDIGNVQSACKNKFTLQTTDDNKEKQYNDNQTFIDVLFSYLKDQNVPKETREKLEIYLKKEEFDTDSMNEDILDYQNGSNIDKTMNDKATFKLIFDEITLSKSYIFIYCIYDYI